MILTDGNRENDKLKCKIATKDTEINRLIKDNAELVVQMTKLKDSCSSTDRQSMETRAEGYNDLKCGENNNIPRAPSHKRKKAERQSMNEALGKISIYIQT